MDRNGKFGLTSIKAARQVELWLENGNSRAAPDIRFRDTSVSQERSSINRAQKFFFLGGGGGEIG